MFNISVNCRKNASPNGASRPLSNGLAVNYMDILEGKPLYMVVFALLWVGDLLRSPMP
jgi:hypothetical protein